MYTQATVRYHTPPYSYASRLGRFFKVLMVALRWRGNEKGCPGFALGGEKRYIYILRILLSKQRQFPSPSLLDIFRLLSFQEEVSIVA